VKNLAYYEAVVQIIPVLFVVLVLEARFFQPMSELFPDLSFRRWWRIFDRMAIILGIGTIAIGETAALHVLDTGRPSDFAHKMTVWALVIEGIGAAWLALGGPRMMTSNQSRNE
jgi:hypothetical protein